MLPSVNQQRLTRRKGRQERAVKPLDSDVTTRSGGEQGKLSLSLSL